MLRSLVDPDVGPPKTFEPVDDTFPQRLMDAVSNGTRAASRSGSRRTS